MKKHFLIAISLLFSFFQTLAQEIEKKWLEEINMGKKLYKTACFDAALKHFKTAAALVPFDTLAFVYIADCGLKTGDDSIVECAVEKLRLLKYNKPFLYEVQAAAMRSIKRDYQAAYALIQEGLNTFPENSMLQYERILTLYQSGNFKETLVKADEFSLKFPRHIDVAKLIINIVTQKNPDFDRAVYYFERMRNYFPSDLDLLCQEVDFYLRNGKIDLAEKKIRQMISISPNDAKLYYNLGLIYYYKNEPEKSIEFCQKSIDLDSNFIDAYYNVGLFYFLTGVDFNSTLSLMNSYQFVNQGKEAIDSALRFFNKAKPYLQKVIITKPGELDAFEALTTIEVLEKNLYSIFPQIDEASKPMISDTVIKPKCKPVLSINKLRFEYPNKMLGILRKGDVGYIKFELRNTGTAAAYGLSAIISEPMAMPYIKYNPTINVDSLIAGSSIEIEIPVSYEQNSPGIRGMKKIVDIASKLRILIKESGGDNSEFAEISFKLDNNNPISETEDDLWETSTIDFSPKPIQQSYLFIIGINKYTYWPELENCIKDASDVKNVLTSKYQFSKKNVFELCNYDANYENLRNELIKIKNEITPYDNLVIYYAGHGYYDDKINEGYWVPVNAHTAQASEYMPTSAIYEFLTKINAKHIVLIADACFSGSLFTSNAINYNENDDESPSRWAFSSGNIELVADGMAGTNSPFAQALIEILSMARRNISISQLVQNVKFKVESITEQSPIGRPLIMEQHKGGDFIFYIK